MHIRLLLLSFFRQFFPDVIRNNHHFILQMPLIEKSPTPTDRS